MYFPENSHSALLTDAQLETSAVVANNRMNRERALFGINSYQKELGIDLLAHLQSRAATEQTVRWIDICCGEANALRQAAEVLHTRDCWPQMHFEGLDLVGIFPPIPPVYAQNLHLKAGSVGDWQPQVQYDLVTCIHGVHYLGDKLGFIQKVLGQLKADGWFVFNLDFNNFKDAADRPMVAWWKQQCKQKGWRYDARRHLAHVSGRQDWAATWEYLGATDQAGPNYSGQAAVDSYYKV